MDVVARFGVEPRCYFAGCAVGNFPTPDFLPLNAAQSHALFSPFAALFLHADLAHLGFNLLFLLVFGGALESELGRIRFLLVYFSGGLVATLAHVVFHPHSSELAIGASGAIAALLGAFLVRLPKAWVLTYFPPYFFFPLPAPLFLLAWLALQIGGAWSHFSFWNAGPSAEAGAQIAWMAHLGGFCWGAFYGWRSGRRKTRGAKKGRKTGLERASSV